MLTAFLPLLTTVSAVPLAPPAVEAVVQQALTNCPNRRRPDEGLVRELFRIELAAGIPPVARGVLAAAACHESAYNPLTRCGDSGASCGLLQLHGSHKRGLRRMGAKGDDPRTDWRVAARYWLERLKRGYRKARRDCPGMGGYSSREAYLWASANKTATWRPKCGRWRHPEKSAKTGRRLRRVCVKLVARCSAPWDGRRPHRAETKHWWRLRIWHAEVRKQMEAGRWQDAPATATARAAR